MRERIRVRVRNRIDSPHLQLTWRDPLTRRIRTRSAGTDDWGRAERNAALLEGELQQRHGQTATGWDLFRKRFEDEHLATLRPSTQQSYFHALNKFERLVGHPCELSAITASVLSEYAARLRRENLSAATIGSKLRMVRAALGWAARMGIIDQPPHVIMPPGGSSRGRSLTLPEVCRYFSALRRTAPRHFADLSLLIKCCWLGGLRLGEAIQLSYDSAPVRVDLSRQYPAIIWSAEGQKSRRNEVSPIPPDFTRLLRRYSPASGLVVGTQLATRTIKEIFTDAGKLAGIRVARNKHATAHDFRRTFGARWAMRVHPLVLKSLMRHRTLETTLRYYVDLDADTIGEKLWTVDGAVDKQRHQAQDPDSCASTKRGTQTRHDGGTGQ